jgi:hypothetical protein
VNLVTFLRYPERVAAADQAIDLEEVIRVLVSIGIEETSARNRFAAADDDRDRLAEVAALAVESEAAVFVSDDMPLSIALFELAEGLRQAGLSVWVGSSASGALGFELGGPRPGAFELQIAPGATPRDLVRAVAQVVPRTHQLLLAIEHEQPDVLPILILDRGSYVWFSAAVGDGALDRAFVRPGNEPGLVQVIVCDAGLVLPDFAERFAQHPPQRETPESSDALRSAFARVSAYDPRVAWPHDNRRPPGEDFFDFCNALAAEPLARALAEGGAALANLLYQFALASLVGAHCDMLAARRNPGMSAQGILGLGQLNWAYFIFDALGADDAARRAGRLLDHSWVRRQERGNIAARQRAYYDLSAFLRSGVRGPSLSRLAELSALIDGDLFRDPHAVRAALLAHSEPLGDQLTHHPLYFAWPAPLYVLARRAQALRLLPRDNPFLAHPLDFSLVDREHEYVRRFEQQLAGFDALDPEHLPPLLDPLPVIVDVQITAVDRENAHGHTLLSAHDDAEHRVVAPHAGRNMQPGEIWLLEVQGSRPASARVHYSDLGEVSCSIALPTGEWLGKA